MASLNGLKYSMELKEKGWEYEVTKELIFGDARMIDPITGKIHGVYEAKEIQDKRELENGYSRNQNTIKSSNENGRYASKECSKTSFR